MFPESSRNCSCQTCVSKHLIWLQATWKSLMQWCSWIKTLFLSHSYCFFACQGLSWNFSSVCFQIFESGVTFPLQDIRTAVVGKTFTSLIILTMTFQLKVLLKIKLFKRLIDVIFCLSHFTSPHICFLYSCALCVCWCSIFLLCPRYVKFL